MKNITEILTGLGIQIPEDKKADFDKAFAENYKTMADYNKQKLEQAQEGLKRRSRKNNISIPYYQYSRGQ